MITKEGAGEKYFTQSEVYVYGINEVGIGKEEAIFCNVKDK